MPRAHGFGVGEIEHDAADIGFVHDVARHDLEHDGRALREYRRGVRDRLLGVRGRECRHHCDVIGVQQLLDFDRIEPMAAVRQRSVHDLPGGLGIGRKLAGHRRRDLRQRFHHLAMPHQMHEAAHRVVFGRIIRNPGAAQEIADLLIRANPDRQHRLGRARCCCRYFDHPGHDARRFRRRDAIAVWTFITRMASLPGSASNTSSAAA